MKLTLRNLGRLREATIDLGKDLILLTGPNNTSKTYVAHALYGFGKALPESVQRVVGNALQVFLDGQAWGQATLRIDLVRFLEENAEQILKDVVKSYRGQLANVLAADDEFVSRSDVVLDVELDFLRKSMKDWLLEAEFSGEMDRLSFRKVGGDAALIVEQVLGLSGANARNSSATIGDEMRQQLRNVLWSVASLFAPLLRLGLTYILSAERAAIQLFSRELALKRTELVDELMQLKSRVRPSAAGDALLETLGQRARRYPAAIRDSLLIANDLAELKKTFSPFAPLAEELERKLLGGALQVDESGEMLFQPEASSSRLGLHLSSSSVKSLAGLSFYLRHLAQEGQFLIIDEPELNLHPDNQRKVARVLARLARSGIKVLISTHSDYVIREINNLVMLSADQDGALRQKHGYSKEETLSPSQVGAYLFDSERAHPIEVTSTGIEVATIEREINALNTVSQDIYFTLFNKPGA